MNEVPFLDCTVPITSIRPFRGCVLVELLPPPNMIGYISLPWNIKARAGMGTVVEETEKFPGQEGIVRALGPEDPQAPFEVGLGDRVVVKHYTGVNMRQSSRSFKLMKGTDIQAVFV